LRRLAEMGGGKILDPQVDNPFLHDRKKTFQALDLQDWLLRLAILLFPFDVAIRRIQLGRDEWERMMRALQRRVFFWKGVPRPKEADESLSALLTRRDQVRSQRPTAPAPELFQPEKAPVVTTVDKTPGHHSDCPVSVASSDEPAQTKEQTTTTSRLLDAKRRAQKRGDK